MKPITEPPPVWRSKGSPHGAEAKVHGDFQLRVQELLERARKIYPHLRAGSWDIDGFVHLSVAEGQPAPTLIRAGERMPIDARVRLGRLDLVATGQEPVVLVHEALGLVRIPAACAVGVQELPSLLDAAATTAVQELVRSALDGDEQSALEVERSLPLSHAELRRALERAPGAAGAARLRLILQLFDDAPLPPVGKPATDRPPTADKDDG